MTIYIIIGIITFSVTLIFQDESKENFISMEKDPHSENWVIEMIQKPLLLGRLCGKRTKKIQYIGSGSSSNWYELPEFNRVTVLKGERLLEIYKREIRNQRILNS